MPKDFLSERVGAALTDCSLTLTFEISNDHNISVTMPRVIGEGLWQAIGTALQETPPTIPPFRRAP